MVLTVWPIIYGHIIWVIYKWIIYMKTKQKAQSLKWYLEWVLKLFSLLIIVIFFMSGLDRISSEINFTQITDHQVWNPKTSGFEFECLSAQGLKVVFSPILLYAALARSCKSDICVDCRDHSWKKVFLNRLSSTDD